MLSNIFQKSLHSLTTEKCIREINLHYLSGQNLYLWNLETQKYLREDELAVSTPLNEQEQMFIWVMRIKRYFEVPVTVTDKNSKSNTAQVIVHFLDKLAGFNEDMQLFLCTNKEVFNCLIFTLLLCKNPTTWNNTLELIKSKNSQKVNKDNFILISLLEWYFEHTFNGPSELSYFELINTLKKEQQEKFIFSEELVQPLILPPSPVSMVFTFLVMHDNYLRYPQDNFISLLNLRLPFFPNADYALYFQTMIFYGHVSFHFTQNKLITNAVDTLSELFRKYVSNSLSDEDLKYSLKRKEFIGFLEFFVSSSLQNIRKIEQAEQLVGLSKLIRSYTLKPWNFGREIYQHGEVLVQKLFFQKQYTEAYLLHDDLYMFGVNSQTAERLSARSSLFCFCHHLDQWLSGKILRLELNTNELFLIANLRKSTLDFQLNVSPVPSLSKLAQQIATRFTSLVEPAQKEQREQCQTYYAIMKHYLKEKQQKELDKILAQALISNKPAAVSSSVKQSSKKDTPQKKTVDKISSTSTSTSSSKSLCEKTSVGEKAIVKSSGIEQLILDVEPSLKKISRSKKKKNMEANVETPQSLLAPREESSSQEQPKTLSKIINPSSFYGSKSLRLFVSKKQIPKELIALINELKKQLPDARFYLTGAASGNLLDKITPNDYDVLVLNASLFEIQRLLNQQKQVVCEMRSRKHPILYSVLSTEKLSISIDFSSKFMKLQMDNQNHLLEDFKRRDFNLNALYLEFTDKDRFRVFSFEKALKFKEMGVISTVGASPEQTLREDPSRLFRLVKLLITNPKYQLETTLKETLDHLSSDWTNIIATYLQQDAKNIYRLDHTLRKLFTRYSFQEINQTLARLNLLSLFTPNSVEECKEASIKIPANIDNKHKYIAWILANNLQCVSKGNNYPNPPFSQFIVTNDFEQGCYDEVRNACKGDKLVQVELVLEAIFSSSQEEYYACRP